MKEELARQRERAEASERRAAELEGASEGLDRARTEELAAAEKLRRELHAAREEGAATRAQLQVVMAHSAELEEARRRVSELEAELEVRGEGFRAGSGFDP